MSLHLATVMRQWRWATHTELKQAAAEIGVSDSVLGRFERGENIGGESVAKIIKWLLSEAEPAPVAQGRLEVES